MMRVFSASIFMIMLGALGASEALAAPDGTPGVTLCDRLAAHPDDRDRVAPPVPIERMDVQRARAACRDALASSNHPRLIYQYGRTFDAENDFEQALEYYRDAFEDGYVRAGLSIFVIWNEHPDLVEQCEASEITQRLIDLAPNLPDVHVDRALILVAGACEDKDLFAAKSHLQRALSLETNPARREEFAMAMRAVDLELGLAIFNLFSGGANNSSGGGYDPNLRQQLERNDANDRIKGWNNK